MTNPEQILEVAKLIHPDAELFSVAFGEDVPEDENYIFINRNVADEFIYDSPETCIALLEWMRSKHKLRYYWSALFETLIMSNLTIPQAVFACAVKIVEGRK